MKEKDSAMKEKSSDKPIIDLDEIGENAYIVPDDIGLSTPEAEEAGDFEGSSTVKRKTKYREPKGSTGKTLYETDFREIDTSTTGTNAKADRNLGE